MSVICVTGVAGFVGSHTADTLLKAGHVVTGIDDFSTGLESNLPSGVDFIHGSILDDSALRLAMVNADYVIHLAARPSVARSLEDPLLTHEINTRGTLNVLELARELKVKRVVVASSSSVYGDTPSLPKREDMPCRPRSPYAVSKLATEAYALAYYHSFGLETVALRYFNVYGPRQRADTGYAAVVPAFVRAALLGEPAHVDGDGRQTRDFTYVEDVARANLLACFGTPGLALNICNWSRTSILDLHAQISYLTGTALKPTHDEPRPGDVRDSFGDPTAASRAISWAPYHTLATGIKATVDAAKKVIDENSPAL